MSDNFMLASSVVTAGSGKAYLKKVPCCVLQGRYVDTLKAYALHCGS